MLASVLAIAVSTTALVPTDAAAQQFGRQEWQRGQQAQRYGRPSREQDRQRGHLGLEDWRYSQAAKGNGVRDTSSSPGRA